MRRVALNIAAALIAGGCLLPAITHAQSATVSTNPPAYQSGSNSLSQTPNGGLRVQPMDGAGHDVSSSHPLPVTSVPATSGLTYSATAAAASSLVLKAAAGVLYGFQVTTGASAGYVMVFDATSAPADGAVTPVKCYSVPATTTMAASWGSSPLTFATGITVVFSTGANCFTKTASATAFISGEAQ